MPVAESALHPAVRPQRRYKRKRQNTDIVDPAERTQKIGNEIKRKKSIHQARCQKNDRRAVTETGARKIFFLHASSIIHQTFSMFN